MTLAFPKPGKSKKPFMVTFPDGREVLNLNTAQGKVIYAIRRDDMSERQGDSCAICHSFQPLFFDYQDGRGADAAHRDDRIIIEGEWHNAALCWDCNTLKGSRRYMWKDGKYQPKEKPCAP